MSVLVGIFHPEEEIGALGPQIFDILLKGLKLSTDPGLPPIFGACALPDGSGKIPPSASERLVAGVLDPQLEVKDTREFHPLLAPFVRVLHRLF